MIVREIEKNPLLLETFDWFNDYDDTLAWAKHSAPELVEKLEDGFKVWLKAYHERIRGATATEHG